MVLINKEKKTNFCHQNVSTTYFGDKLPLVKDKGVQSSLIACLYYKV
jgi:hypothetical protein